MNQIILFDGECVFCSRAVNFILKRDRNRVFRFSASQSGAGKALLERFGISGLSGDTLVLMEQDRYRLRSDAVLEIFRHLGIPWKWFSIFRFFPQGLRDAVYSFVAEHRNFLGGRKDACDIPTEEEKDRFLM